MLITFGGQRGYTRDEAAAHLAALGLPVPADFGRANCFLSPLGEAPGRGWLLLSRASLNALTLDSLQSLVLTDDLGTTLTFHSLVYVTARNLMSGVVGDASALYLVEIADSRWRCHNAIYSVPLVKQYNVRAPAWGGVYYDDSRNAGSDWTWTTLITDVWNTMSAQLGTFPSLPVSPNGTPEGWIFNGEPAWQALNQLLWRVGCAVACDLTKSTAQYSIVQVGATDTVNSSLITSVEAKGKRIADEEFIEAIRGRVPYGVEVAFHRQQSDYGTERTTPKDLTQWNQHAIYTVQVVGPDSASAEPGVYTLLWDDLPALYDATGTLTNSAALSTRATERSNDYFRMLRTNGGTRLHKTYSGIYGFTPGSILKGVAWRESPEFGAFTTEIVRHPFRMLRSDDAGQWMPSGQGVGSTQLQAPFWGPQFPVYPHLMQCLRLGNGTPDGSGRFDATLQVLNPATLSQIATESIWAVEMNSLTPLTANAYYPARLVGYNNGRPLYQIKGGDATTNYPATFNNAVTFTNNVSITPGTSRFFVIGPNTTVTLQGPSSTFTATNAPIYIQGPGSGFSSTNAPVTITGPTSNFSISNSPLMQLDAANTNYGGTNVTVSSNVQLLQVQPQLANFAPANMNVTNAVQLLQVQAQTTNFSFGNYNITNGVAQAQISSPITFSGGPYLIDNSVTSLKAETQLQLDTTNTGIGNTAPLNIKGHRPIGSDGHPATTNSGDIWMTELGLQTKSDTDCGLKATTPITTCPSSLATGLLGLFKMEQNAIGV